MAKLKRRGKWVGWGGIFCLDVSGGPWLWPGPQGSSSDSRTGSLAAEEIPEQRQGKA